jgi:ferric-dicitrate binding protein FerR (iron transport regulator)
MNSLQSLFAAFAVIGSMATLKPHAAEMPLQLAVVEAVEPDVRFRARFSITPANPPWIAVKLKDMLGQGELRTSAHGRVTLRLAEGSRLQLQGNTRIVLDSLTQQDERDSGSATIVLQQGGIEARPSRQVRKQAAFIVKTSVATSTAEDDAFSVRHDVKEVTTVTAIEGSTLVQAQNGAGSAITLSAGQQISLSRSGTGRIIPAAKPAALSR